MSIYMKITANILMWGGMILCFWAITSFAAMVGVTVGFIPDNLGRMEFRPIQSLTELLVGILGAAKGNRILSHGENL